MLMRTQDNSLNALQLAPDAISRKWYSSSIAMPEIINQATHKPLF